MSSEPKDEFFQEKMMQDLGRENERFRIELRNKASACTGSKSETTGDRYGYKKKFEDLVEINHGWKQDYERLETQYEMLSREKRQLEYQKRGLRGFVNRLQKRRVLVESENKKLAAVVDAQQTIIDSWRRDSVDGGRQARLEEECEALKSQMLVYMEDLKQERKDREKFQEEIREYKKKVDEQEKTSRKLTTQLDAYMALVEAHGGRGNGHRGQNGGTPLRQVRFIQPHHPVDEICPLQQQNEVVLPRNGQPLPLIHGGEMKSGYSEEL